MKLAEISLLRACRDRLRLPQNTSGGGGGYSETECEVEFDEMAPATVGKVYVAALPGGWRPGPHHNTSGGVNDLVYSVRIAVVRRISNVPRDRKRSVFLDNLDSLDDDIDRIYSVVDWKYELINAASAIILAEGGSSEGFIEPLRLVGEISQPREVGSEFFGGKPGDAAGMMRVLPFGGARRVTVKT